MSTASGRAVGAVFNVVCTYESLALNLRLVPATRPASRFLPPISHGLWRLRPAARAAVVGTFVVLLLDHLFTRRWS